MKKITMMMSALALVVSASVSAQSFSDDFEDGAADARWFTSTIGDGTISPLDMAAKYSDLGITAPTNGGEYCVKMQANVLDAGEGKGQANFLGILPKASFSGAYTVTFDGYAYYDGSSGGSTEAFTWGVGQENDAENEGFRLAVFADNGSSRDVRLYKDGTELSYDATATAYSYAGISQNGNLDAPDVAVYQKAYEGDAATPDTKPYNKWLSIKVEVTATAVIYSINGVEFARNNEVPANDKSIVIGYLDPFTGSLNTTSYFLVDNVEITAGNLANEENVLNNVSVYPNPAQGMVNVSVEGKANFQLFNISGQSVMNMDIKGTTSIDVSGLNSGLYFSRITNEAGATKTLKLQIK